MYVFIELIDVPQEAVAEIQQLRPPVLGWAGCPLRSDGENVIPHASLGTLGPHRRAWETESGPRTPSRRHTEQHVCPSEPQKHTPRCWEVPGVLSFTRDGHTSNGNKAFQVLEFQSSLPPGFASHISHLSCVSARAWRTLLLLIQISLFLLPALI